MSSAERRLMMDLKEFYTNPMQGIYLDAEVEKNIKEWIIRIDGPNGSIYEGETFKLQFNFNDNYPFDSPIVTFIGDNIPLHSHIYSNGHICLNILYDYWTPALSVASVCLSIKSMLSSATKKERPPTDESYTQRCSKNPKNTRWNFHDDTV